MLENCPFNKTSYINCGWLKDDCCSYTKKCILDKGEKCPLVKSSKPEVDAVLDSTKQEDKETSPSMSVLAVPKPTAYVLEKGSSDKNSDEISNILEKIRDVQAELICRHQFGNNVRPSLENTSEKDLCERGFRLFYMLRNKYQGKDAIIRDGK